MLFVLKLAVSGLFHEIGAFSTWKNLKNKSLINIF